MKEGDKHPEVPSCCSTEMAKLIKRCWDDSPSKRPSFDEIYELIKYGEEGMKARQAAEDLLRRMGELDTKENLRWSLGGGTEFNQLCELLKTNAIPTTRFEFKGMLTLH